MPIAIDRAMTNGAMTDAERVLRGFVQLVGGQIMPQLDYRLQILPNRYVLTVDASPTFPIERPIVGIDMNTGLLDLPARQLRFQFLEDFFALQNQTIEDTGNRPKTQAETTWRMLRGFGIGKLPEPTES